MLSKLQFTQRVECLNTPNVFLIFDLNLNIQVQTLIFITYYTS